MTHSEFWKLMDAGDLVNLSIWRKEQEDIDPEFQDFRNEVVAFTYNGKFYLRIVRFCGYDGIYTGRGGNRHFVRKAVHRSSYIKEFESKHSANAYFKKAAAGYTRQ